jgi:dCTP deaminase
MILTKETLLELNKNNELIEGAEEDQFQIASIDLRLDNEFLIMDENYTEILDFDSKPKYKKIISESIIIPPKSFILGVTKEFVKIPLDCGIIIEGRSSIGRLGLFIQNAGWGNPGNNLKITLELFNASNVPIKVSAGRRICQILFLKLDKKIEKGYSGKYQNQKEVLGSKISEDV